MMFPGVLTSKKKRKKKVALQILLAGCQTHDVKEAVKRRELLLLLLWRRSDLRCMCITSEAGREYGSARGELLPIYDTFFFKAGAREEGWYNKNRK